jgi:hypothetical protein
MTSAACLPIKQLNVLVELIFISPHTVRKNFRNDRKRVVDDNKT